MFNQKIKKYSVGVLLGLLCANVAQAQIQVFACEPEWAALIQALGGDAVKVYSATTAQQDPHHIQARPSLIAKVRRADLLVCTGAELETGWLPLLLRKSGNGKVQPGQQGYFLAADQVSLLEKPAVLDRSLGDIHASGNPHIHFDPHRILQIANALGNRLITVDTANRELYQKNLKGFTAQWQQAIARWEQIAQPLRGKPIVVSHNSWIYLEQWLGLKQVAVLEPKPGIPPSSSHLSKLLSVLQKSPADIILIASYQNDRSARWLSQKTGVPVVKLAFSPTENQTLIQWFDQIMSQLVSNPS